MKSGGQSTLKGTQRPKQENNAIPRVAPKWLKHDRQVSFPSPNGSQQRLTPLFKRKRVVSLIGFKFYYYMVDPSSFLNNSILCLGP
jgi:hypothetical protein